MIKGIVKIAPIVLLAISLTGCMKCEYVKPGSVGILVDLIGEDRGVEQDYTLETGRVWYNTFKYDLYQFPVSIQREIWTQATTEGSPNDDSITFNSCEGTSINVDIALAYQVSREAVPSIFVRFRMPIEQLTRGYLRDRIRDAFGSFDSQMTTIDIIGRRRTELCNNVTESLNNQLNSEGFIFDSVSIVGNMRLPDNVRESVNNVVMAQQEALAARERIAAAQANAQSAAATASGEAARVLIQAQAQAEANRLIAESTTPTIVAWQAIQRWNGITPQVLGIGGNGATPLVSIPNQPANTVGALSPQ